MKKEPSARERRGVARAVGEVNHGGLDARRGRAYTKVDGDEGKDKHVDRIIEVADVSALHQTHGTLGSAAVKLDAVGRVMIATVGAVVGEVEGADGEDGAHDEVALEADLDDGDAPKVTDVGVGGQCGVGEGGEVVEELELEHREMVSIMAEVEGRRSRGGRDGGVCGTWGIGGARGRWLGENMGRGVVIGARQKHKGTPGAVGEAVDAGGTPSIALKRGEMAGVSKVTR